eukprot:COSAG02_NODE_784_length_17232_cov_12.871651_12_plen_85_part_00
MRRRLHTRHTARILRQRDCWLQSDTNSIAKWMQVFARVLLPSEYAHAGVTGKLPPQPRNQTNSTSQMGNSWFARGGRSTRNDFR